MTVVLDSGIRVSAMQFRGTPFDAVLKAVTGDRIAVCRRMREEIVRVLTGKFRWEARCVLDDLDFYWQHALTVEIQGGVAKGICRDPNDEFILECAGRAGATGIVTGDRDLLSLSSYQDIEIVTARQYLEWPHAAPHFTEISI